MQDACEQVRRLGQGIGCLGWVDAISWWTIIWLTLDKLCKYVLMLFVIS